MKNRPIIIHFHFFKNAGTSIESILRKNFKEHFITFEPGGATETFPASTLVPLLEERDELAAVSSHTISFPAPRRENWNIFPIVFLRHPLARIVSMYSYEKNQDSQSPGAILAKEHGLTGYIEARLKNPGERTLRNYQTWMLARGQTSSRDDRELLCTAKKTIDEIPVVGLVEKFDESIQQLSDWLKPYFPSLEMTPEHQNRSDTSGLSLSNKLQRLKDSIGDDLYARLEHENLMDIELHDHVVKKLEQHSL